MKNKTVILSIALSAVLAASPALIGCSTDNYTAIWFDVQETSYEVHSQGGSAVSYGNYVYFINGTRGYDDLEGADNVWGSVIKGGIFRAEYNSGDSSVKAHDDRPWEFSPVRDSDGSEFKHSTQKAYYHSDDYERDIEVIDSTLIAPKTAGTSGYKNGGLFIYDDYLYFASPNNSKSATGNVQTGRTDFFMMPLSGGKPSKIYTTSEGVSTSSAEYAFYKYADAVYLVVNEEGTIVTVRVNTAKAKGEDPVKYEVGATSVYFPVRSTYYYGIDNNTPEDFIYFVRSVLDDRDPAEQRAGTVIEAMRPNGDENFSLFMSGNTEKIEAVRDGVLFYSTTDNQGNTVIAYDSLHDSLMDGSESYKARQDEIAEYNKNKSIAEQIPQGMQFDGRFPTAITSSITATYPFRPDLKSTEVMFVGATSSALSLYSVDGTVTDISDTTGTPLFIERNYLYFSDSGSSYYRVAMWPNMENAKVAQEVASSTSTATFDCDYVDGYFVYLAGVDDWASAYTYFYNVDGLEGIEPMLAGERSDSDKPTAEELDELINGKDEEESDEE